MNRGIDKSCDRELVVKGTFVGPPFHVDREEDVEQSPSGGLNSKVVGRWDLLDFDALERLASVIEYGCKYGEDNWRLDSVELHLNHAISHLFRYLRERRRLDGKSPPFTRDGRNDELGHAFCRVMFALAVETQSDEDTFLAQQHLVENPVEGDRLELLRACGVLKDG